MGVGVHHAEMIFFKKKKKKFDKYVVNYKKIDNIILKY